MSPLITNFFASRLASRCITAPRPFANDGSLSSLIMKALKRTMAGEYSRELGVKVLDRHEPTDTYLDSNKGVCRVTDCVGC